MARRAASSAGKRGRPRQTGSDRDKIIAADVASLLARKPQKPASVLARSIGCSRQYVEKIRNSRDDRNAKLQKALQSKLDARDAKPCQRPIELGNRPKQQQIADLYYPVIDRFIKSEAARLGMPTEDVTIKSPIDGKLYKGHDYAEHLVDKNVIFADDFEANKPPSNDAPPGFQRSENEQR